MRERTKLGARPREDLRVCLWDSEVDEKGKLWLSCRRLALPDRRVCHKHAPMVARRRKKSDRRRMVRSSRRANR